MTIYEDKDVLEAKKYKEAFVEIQQEFELFKLKADLAIASLESKLQKQTTP